MTVVREFFTDFSSGLFSSTLEGRVDIPQYKKACRVLRNWWPKLAGGAERRPGSLYLSDLNAIDIRYEPWIFSETQEYIAVFTLQQLRIYDPDTGSLVAQVTGVNQIAPWNSSQIPELKVTALGDVMLVFHKDLQTLLVRRKTASLFVAERFDWEKDKLGIELSPFWKFASPEATLQPSGHSGAITLTASEDVFDPDHVGTIFRYRGKQVRVTDYLTAKLVNAVTVEELDRAVRLRFTYGRDTGTDFKVGEIVVGRDTGIKAVVIAKSRTSIDVASIGGYFGSSSSNEQVEGLESGNIAEIAGRTVLGPLADTEWDEQAFNRHRGWPGVGEFHAQRLWVGGSSSLPAHLFGSKRAAYFNFDVGEAFPDDSIQILISDSQINTIVDLVSGEHLLVFTDHAEFYAPQSEQRPLVPETFNLLKQSQYGCSKKVRPKNMGGKTLFVQGDGNAIREMQWDNRRRKYVSPPISVLAEEYLKGVTDIAVLDGGYERPETIAFFINGNNQIVYYHASEDEQLRAWGIWDSEELDPIYKTLAVSNDKLFVGVEREIDGNGPRSTCMERFEFGVTLDCAKQNVHAATSSLVTSHPVLKDQDVGVVGSVSTSPAYSNDWYLGKNPINAAGTVTISGGHAVQNMTVGLPFDQRLEIMPIEIQLPNGWTVGMPKRIVSVDALVRSTLHFRQQGQGMRAYQVNQDMSIAPSPATGKFKFYNLGWSERQTVTFENLQQVACELLAFSCEVEV